MYLEKPGADNTETTLAVVKEEALKRNVRYILVATTTGDTGLKAARLLKETSLNLIAITHNTGFRETGVQELDSSVRKEIESMGGTVFTGTMVLRGVGAAIRGKMNYSQEQVVADTLRMMGQGTKVCAEITAMTADAGLIPFEDIIAVGGTGRGADTALLISANSSNRFFDIKIKEILVKPRNF